jgi:hypothetical protein
MAVLNQVVVVCHQSAENLFLELRLLRLAPETEVRNQIPLTGGIEFVRDEGRDTSGWFGEESSDEPPHPTG